MKISIAAAGLLLSLPVLAQENPIDGALRQCLDGAVSTLAMTDCYLHAGSAWDKAMNAQYQQLMKSLSGAPQAQLRTAQRQWLAYRDSWQAASGAYFAHTQGTLAQVSVAAQRVALVRNQTLMLQSLREGSCASGADC